MSVILIRPRNTAIPREIISTQYPINLGYLSAWLKKHAIDVTILDFEVEDFGEDRMTQIINDRKPILIGISCVTSTIVAGHDVASSIKKSFPDIKIVIGGAHSTAIPLRTLNEFPSFDIVVKGEGELTLLELYTALAQKGTLSEVKGLVYRDKNSDLVDTGFRPLIENLDSLPFVDRDVLDMNLYRRTHATRGISRLNRNISEIITARGCPYACIFCAIKITFGRHVRYRTVGNIIQEMDECIQKYQTNHFSIMDDTATFKKDVLYPICDYLKEKKITWDCCTRVDRIDETMIKRMIDSGCEKISFGVESGSEKILKLIRKDVTIQQIKDAFRFCKRLGLRYTEATFMIGSHPSETMEDINATLDLIMEIDPDLVACSITAPFPGTEFHKIMKEKGYLDTENWNDFIHYGGVPAWRYEHLDPHELSTIQKKFTKRFYLRFPYILRQLKKVRHPKEICYWVNLAMGMLKYS